MVKITVNTTNTVALSLSEMTTVTNPYYLFSIYSEMQNEVVKNFLSSDLSTTDEKTRYNRFSIVEVGSGGVENLNTGRIRLPYNGTYLLKVYAQTSSSNLNPSLANELVHTEVLKVYGNSEGSYEEYTGNDTDFTTYKFEE